MAVFRIAFLSLIRGCQAFTHIIGFCHIFGELFVPNFGFMGFIKQVAIIFGIVNELIGIKGIQCFRIAKDMTQGFFIFIQNSGIAAVVEMTFRCIHRHNHSNNSSYRTILNENEESLRHVFGYAETLYAFDTYQFIDYSKYDCDLFDEAHKAKVRDEQFPKDMAKAYDMGKRLATMNKA